MYYSLHRNSFKERFKMSNKFSKHRETTLKWNLNGELSELDMLRILEMIPSTQLNECKLTCDRYKK